MLVVIFVSGIEDGFVRECQTFDGACKYITDIGQERINKVVITDLQPAKTVTKADIARLLKL